MTLTREEIVGGIPPELRRFAELVAPLTTEQLATETRCEGWTVAHVAGHVIGSVTDVVAGRLEGQGTAEVTERQATERAGHSGVQLAEELRSSIPTVEALLGALPVESWDESTEAMPGRTLGFAVESMWFDSYLHGEDIRAALDQLPTRGPGLRCTVHHLAAILELRKWGPATLALEGIEEIPIGGGGPRVQGDPHTFAMAATGRTDPAVLGLGDSVNVFADS